jgi:hypothetical protein
MKRLFLAAALMLAVATSLSADVKIVATTKGKVMFFNTDGPTTTYIKGTKMRTDQRVGSTTHTVILDVGDQKMYSFDSKKKEAEVTDMAALAEEVAKVVSPDGVTASVKPNGQTKAFEGKTASGYDVLVTMTAMIGAKKDGTGGMPMTTTVTGDLWVVKGAPGTAEYAGFYKAAAEKGFLFTDARSAKAQPGQAKSMSEMYRQFAALGGVVYESNISVKMGAEGPMAFMAKMGNVSFSTVVDAIDSGPLPDDMFAPPAGYKLKVVK